MGDFDFLDEYFNQYLQESEKVHQVIGIVLSNYIGHTMMTEVLKKTKLGSRDKDSELKYDKSIIPEGIFKQIYTFSSLICRPKEEIERYDKEKSPSKMNTGGVSFNEELISKNIYQLVYEFIPNMYLHQFFNVLTSYS